ncbi:MAG: cupin domain-containing protein [Candidatus Bathyarchaeia archaeon]
MTHGRLWEWPIWTRRVDEKPDRDTGAVCFNLDTYSRCLLREMLRTDRRSHEGQAEFLYVVDGCGSVEIAGERWPIRPGHIVRIPAGASHVIANESDYPLELVAVRNPPGRGDETVLVYHWQEPRLEAEQRSEYGPWHWNHLPLGAAAGFLRLDVPPRSLPEPHAHPPGMDEIWYVLYGEGWHWVGRELQHQPAGAAVWVQPGEQHSMINATDGQLEILYCARRRE